jgi:hypothetical protein
MARSTMRSNQRPDTLMQDRICRIDENLSQRTAGPYIRVKPCRKRSLRSGPLLIGSAEVAGQMMDFSV